MKNNFKFVIRDDDLNFFSSPDDINRWYADIFAAGIPVGFAAIPFVRPQSDVYTGSADPAEDSREHAFSANRSLVEYVRSQPLIELMQHGCTHVTESGMFEYQKSSGLFDDTLRGKKELENAWGRPVAVFIAPHDQFSNHALESVEKNNLNINRSKGTRNFRLDPRSLGTWVTMVSHRLRYLFTSPEKRPAYPMIRYAGSHQEAYSYRIELGLNRLLEGLSYAQTHGNHFVVTLHIHDMDDEKKRTLIQLIDAAKNAGAAFIYPRELFI